MMGDELIAHDENGMTPMRINGEYFLVDAVLASAIVTRAEGYRAEINALRAENAALRTRLAEATAILRDVWDMPPTKLLGNLEDEAQSWLEGWSPYHEAYDVLNQTQPEEEPTP